MAKNEKMTLDQWIQELNGANQGELIAYQSLFNKKMTRKAFKDLVFKNTFNRLCNLVLKMYKWKLPETFNQRAIETGLLWRGFVCAYHKPGMGDYCLPCSPTNSFTVYGEPTQVNVYGFNGYQEWVDILQPYDTPLPQGATLSKTPTKNEGVVMRDNDRAYPYINYVNEYAIKIADKLIALNIATQRLKSPFVYTVVEKEMKDTVEAMIDRIEDNEDLIIKLKGTTLPNGADPVQLTQNPMNPDIVKAIKESILFDFDMFLETIGINTNPTPDKSQYVSEIEVGSNNSLIDLERDVRFLNRKKFCEDAKRIGITMSVEVNIDEMKQQADQFKKEVNNVGQDKASSDRR